MTPKQKLVLDFINTYIKIKGFPPSYQDVAKGLGLRSKSNIHRIIHQLRSEGFIKVKPHLVRSLELVDKTYKEMVNM